MPCSSYIQAQNTVLRSAFGWSCSILLIVLWAKGKDSCKSRHFKQRQSYFQCVTSSLFSGTARLFPEVSKRPDEWRHTDYSVNSPTCLDKGRNWLFGVKEFKDFLPLDHQCKSSAAQFQPVLQCWSILALNVDLLNMQKRKHFKSSMKVNGFLWSNSNLI